jgi:hypothetical protein
MRRPAIFLQALAWAALWGFWVVASRHNHPNLRRNAIASGLLVATFAAAGYTNHLRLIPSLRRERRNAVYSAALLLVMGLLALACTAAIHVMYDILWGPDPARFGFRANLIGQGTHQALGVSRLSTRASRRDDRRPIPTVYADRDPPA